MIDIRCHILHGMGCGPDTFDESVEMCRQAASQGVRTIVATPLWDAQPSTPPPINECQEKLNRLKEQVNGTLSLKLGFLIRFSAALPDLLDRYNSSLTLCGSRYLVVSLPSIHNSAEVEDVWGRLSERGYHPIVAHPECSLTLRRDEAPLKDWVAGGALLQIDAASITGAHGREVQRLAMKVLTEFETSSVVASNAHDTANRRSLLSQARTVVAKKLSGSHAHIFFSDLPAAIIDVDHANGNRNRNHASRSRSLAVIRSLRSPDPIPDQ